MPEFSGGDIALRRFISQNFKYPLIAQKSGVQGKIIVGSIINTLGEVTNITIRRSVDPYLDSEAIRVVNLLPDFIPGCGVIQVVEMPYILPIIFIIVKIATADTFSCISCC